MSTTKKMPSSLGKDGQPGRGSEFVIPNPCPNANDGFFGIKTGKTHQQAAITFIGRSISPEDVIEKIKETIADQTMLRTRIEDFLDQLQAFKVGNVISISYAADGSFTLKLEAVSPPTHNRKSLP
jgi:hypothetical protein